jgi:hypothetical protein
LRSRRDFVGNIACGHEVLLHRFDHHQAVTDLDYDQDRSYTPNFARLAAQEKMAALH